MAKRAENASKSKNDSGFTYLEVLVSLGIAAFIMALLPSLLALFNYEEEEMEFEHDFFIIDISQSYKDSTATDYEPSQESIVFMDKTNKVRYRRHGSRIIKTVGDKGYVTVMFNVTEFKVEETDESVILSFLGKGMENEEQITFIK
ncbi:competence type IV pilus minor pilin ComGF [Salinicoccus siamensis]|uniref:Competence type IV pilus minor pilin ComGF n=1 Tax=Salinicoccus siamensis TaxID=381830 RepID=A0ABV5Z1P7_9STAP